MKNIIKLGTVTLVLLILLATTNASVSLTERMSPYNHINENQINIQNDKVVISINKPQWAKFTDTNSMDPVFDAESNTIEFAPTNPEQIHQGDIISYKSELLDTYIAHRVIETGYDSQGWYAYLKGDNNYFRDIEKVRFDQVHGVVVAVIY